MNSPPPFLQAQKNKMPDVLSLLGPHVRYIQKPDNSPCSITDSVKRFPKEEATEGNATSPPQNPPTNLTVVTVEGCPSFVILDWDKPLNDTVTGKSMACGLLLWWETLIRWCFGNVVPQVRLWPWVMYLRNSKSLQSSFVSWQMIFKIVIRRERSSLSWLWSCC